MRPGPSAYAASGIREYWIVEQRIREITGRAKGVSLEDDDSETGSIYAGLG